MVMITLCSFNRFLPVVICLCALYKSMLLSLACILVQVPSCPGFASKSLCSFLLFDVKMLQKTRRRLTKRIVTTMRRKTRKMTQR